MTEIDWKKLSAQFPKNQVSKKPKFRVVKASNGRTDTTGYDHCDICGGWHPTKGVVHLDYVGHADITARLNDVAGPENWSIEPMAYNADGTPLQSDGGMWCWMTIGETRKMCFGDAQGKSGPDAVKEIIGDAIRNGAMRFGVGTYLWSKSDAASQLIDDNQPESMTKQQSTRPAKQSAKKQVSPEKKALYDAADRLKKAIADYAKATGGNAENMHAGVKKRPDFENSTEFYLQVASEFEQETKNCEERLEF
jgi:hypothetical protein